MPNNENRDVTVTTEMAPKNDFEVKKLSGSDNYHTWQFAMLNYFELNNLDDCILGSEADPKIPKERKPERLKQAKARLALSLDETLYTHVRKATSALEMWNILKNMFEDKGLIRKIGLLRQLISVRLEKSTSMQSYVNEIITTSNKLSGIGFDIDDEWLGAILLAGLTEEYKPLIMSLEGSSITITADTVKQKLMDTQEEDSASGEAFFAKKNKYFKGRSRSIKCYTCGGKNHKSADCLLKSGDSSESESDSVEPDKQRGEPDKQRGEARCATHNPLGLNGSTKTAFSATHICSQESGSQSKEKIFITAKDIEKSVPVRETVNE